MTGANQAHFTHQAGNPLEPMLGPVSSKLSMDARCAIDIPGTGVHRPDLLQQGSVGLRMGRGRTVTPSVIARRGDAEHARHDGNRKYGLVRAHEPEDPDGIVPVSRANQAAAFERLESQSGSRRSRRSWRTSRRSLMSSSHSALNTPPNPSSRRPSLRSAWATQYEWTALLVQTRAPNHPDRVQHGPSRSSGAETPAHRVGGSWV